MLRVIEEYRRKRFFESVDHAYAALRRDPEAWAEEERERREWDATLSDGLEDD